MKKHLLLILITILSCTTLYSSEPKLEPVTDANPYYIRAQFAGNLGLVSIGAGRTFAGKQFSTDLNYGFLPKWVNGVRVHTFSLKALYSLPVIQISNLETGFFIGTSLTYSITRNTYVNYPEYYPNGYYASNAIHLNPFLGAMIELPCLLENVDYMQLYSELGTVDYKIWYGLKNKTIKPDEIWNLCFGMTFHLK